jgi:hypothetical protein
MRGTWLKESAESQVLSGRQEHKHRGARRILGVPELLQQNEGTSEQNAVAHTRQSHTRGRFLKGPRHLPIANSQSKDLPSYAQDK